MEGGSLVLPAGMPDGTAFSVLVTIPVHNEAPRLERSLKLMHAALEASGLNYRLSVFEDGSTDGTKELLPRLQAKYPRLIVRQYPQKMGRGWALRTNWKDQPYDVLAFCDADLATGPDAMIQAIRKVREGNGVVIGSRYAQGAIVRRPPGRKFASKVYNSVLRTTFDDGILDHQCGLKAFSREALERILPASIEDSWFWDTEALVLARALSIPIAEVPVVWTEQKAKRTHYRRLVSDIYLHGSGILRLKDGLRERLKGPPRVSLRSTPPGSVTEVTNMEPFYLASGESKANLGSGGD